MGFVFIQFPDSRSVIVDEIASGNTNEVFEVETGTHFFSLEAPRDFKPRRRKLAVPDNSALDPLEIVFTKRASS